MDLIEALAGVILLYLVAFWVIGAIIMGAIWLIAHVTLGLEELHRR